jgi:hypothetical protein
LAPQAFTRQQKQFAKLLKTMQKSYVNVASDKVLTQLSQSFAHLLDSDHNRQTEADTLVATLADDLCAKVEELLLTAGDWVDEEDEDEEDGNSQSSQGSSQSSQSSGTKGKRKSAGTKGSPSKKQKRQKKSPKKSPKRRKGVAQEFDSAQDHEYGEWRVECCTAHSVLYRA